MRARAFAALALPVAVLMLAATSGATTGTLPGGTSFEVRITSPSSGAVLPEATPVFVTGQATVGAAAPVANTVLITAIDVSGSTVNAVSTSACGNQNPTHDSVANTVLDCEIASAEALNAAAISAGTVADVGVIGFAGRILGTNLPLVNEAAPLTIGPGPGMTLMPPASELTHNGIPDVVDAIDSAYNDNVPGTVLQPVNDLGVGFTSFTVFTSPGNTNYWAAVTQIRALAASPAVAGMTKIAVMLSDGDSNVGGPSNQPVSAALAGIAATGLKIYTFAIGNLASCLGSGSGFGTLQEIANATGATCTRIANPGDAVAAVPAAIGSTIAGYQTSAVGASGPFDLASGSPVPPATFLSGGILKGPGTVNIGHTYPASVATPGPKTFCVRATGSDGGGSESLTDCVDVTIKARPTVTIPGGSVGVTPEGTALSLTGAVTDATTTSWTATGGTGHCTFADPAAVNTSVTCDDDGIYTLTLTATDGVNVPVSSSETLTVTNADPVPTLALSPDTIPLDGTVLAHTTIADPGTNDTQTCSNAWGDGTPSSLGCDDSHVYTTAGTYTVTTTATDDDGGTGTSTASVVVNGPPTASVSDATGAEGSAIPVHATATDAEHDTLSYHWAAAPASGVDPGAACTFSDASALNPTISCTDDGTWTLSLTVSDNVNIDVVASGTLTVSNANPVPTLGLSPGTIPLHGTTLAHTTIVDPGSNDTHTCSNAWGDGAPSSLGCDDSHVYDTAGTYTVTTTVTDDDGGTGTSTALIVVNGPPTVTVADSSGAEGSAIALHATTSDAEHDTLSYHWTAAPASGVDPGAACTFSDASALNPTISCTDDGTWTLSLTVSDNVNIDVVASGTLTVSNVNPTATLAVTPGAIPLHGSVSAHTSIADAGSNDTQSCTITWGDGTPDTTGCDGSHTYDTAGTMTVTVTVTDDDGGSTTATRSMLVNAPPVVSVANVAGNEGSAVALSATATDPDGDTLTYAWTAAPSGPVDAGAACAFSNPAALGSTLTCTDDGLWTVTLTVSDGINPPVTSSGTVTIANRPPTLTVSSPAAGATSRTVTFTGAVTDPGSNDTATCLIAWGDGTTSTVAVAGGTCGATHTYATSLSGATIDASATDDDGGVSAHVTRALTFNRAPICSTVKVIPSTLWPPTGTFRIALLYGASDPDGGPVTYHVDSVTQDEALSKWDDDHHWYDRDDDNHYKKTKKLVPDAARGIGPIFFLRAWRDPHGDGRVYTVGFTVTDSSGSSCSGTVTVTVQHDEHHPAKKTPGVSVNSFGG